jgi:hypothetical protein
MRQRNPQDHPASAPNLHSMQPPATTKPAPAPGARQRDWALFTALTFLFSFGFAVYMGVFQNFLRDRFSADAMMLGRLESLREVPGLLAALTAGTLAALAESRVAALGLLITAVGIALTGVVSGFGAVLAVTIFWSVGFHLYASMGPAITLTLAQGQESGRHLGRMQAVGSVATPVALGVALLMAQVVPRHQYAVYFFLTAACLAGAALLCSMLSAHAAGAPRARLILRREYSLYYLMTFLEGCRRQIFDIFATFVLIVVYKVPLGAILALKFSNAILIALTAPRIGRIIDRRGERGPMTFYAIALILVFIGYGTVKSVGVLFALYIIDNVLFSFGVGCTTYLHRIVRPGELTPCLTMGTTMNHIAAVTIPITGAWLWHQTNYQVPFWLGVAVATMGLIATRWLPAGARVPSEAAGMPAPRSQAQAGVAEAAGP